MPRKTGKCRPDRPQPLDASMRPRPDAAENPVPPQRPDPRPLTASMRPRPDAAENRGRRGPGAAGPPRRFNEAAARCRGKPHCAAINRHSGSHASMRLRPDAAENPPRDPARRRGFGCFNEAAARCRGKPGCAAPGSTAAPRRFNEAAARCRGKPRLIPRAVVCTACFNEAAARCRGKPGRRRKK